MSDNARLLWRMERLMGDIRVDNYVPHAQWRFLPSAEEGKWTIELYRPCEKDGLGLVIARVGVRMLTPTIYLSERLWVAEDYRRQGISEKLFNVEWRFVHDLLRGCGLIAFVTDSNTAQVARLRKLGWTMGSGYTDEDCLKAHVWLYSPYGFFDDAVECVGDA